jgi:hypothetical protein
MCRLAVKAHYASLPNGMKKVGNSLIVIAVLAMFADILFSACATQDASISQANHEQWYLVFPPGADCPGLDECVDLQAPLKEWPIEDRFDSREACQADMPRWILYWREMAQCVSSSDPRLKSN